MCDDSPAVACVVRATFLHVVPLHDERPRRRSASLPAQGSHVCGAAAAPPQPPLYVLDGATWRGAAAPALPLGRRRPTKQRAAQQEAPSDASTQAGSCEAQVDASGDGGDGEVRTTMMMRNIPGGFSRRTLLELLGKEGFRDEVDFIYLPADFRTGAITGYAFVNLTSAAAAKRFRRHFHHFGRWGLRTRLVCNVSWARDDQQGLTANVERYRNSSVMHPSVADKLRPVLLARGAAVPFPPPTRRVWPPRAS